MSRISDSHLAAWFEQLADALDAGMNPVNAVALASALPGGASERITASLERGEDWISAFDGLSPSFTDAELAVLQAAERTGSLPSVLRRLAEARRDRAQTKRRLLVASLYPVFLLHFAAVVFSVTYLANGQLPAFFVSAGMIVVPFWLLVLFIYAMARLFPSAFKRLLRFVPLLRAYRRSRGMAQLCSTLAMSFRAGMSADDAWQAGIAAADNPQIDRMGEAALRAIANGQPASSGIAGNAEKLPGSFLQLYRGGETTGTLEQNLEAAAEAYGKEAKSRLFWAMIVYPKILLVAIFGYVAYKILTFFIDYYNQILEMSV